MTRDEQRLKCTAAIKRTMLNHYDRPVFNWDIACTAAFDALNGIARVGPVEATNKMITAGAAVFENDPYAHTAAISCWNAMSAAGDLTNPPEKKT